MIASRLSAIQQRFHPRLLATATSNNIAFRSSTTPIPSASAHTHTHHLQQHRSRRGIVTSSIPPPLDVPMERPEIVVLAESSLYKHSWRDHSSSYYPSRGLHFASVDIMQQTSSSYTDDDRDDEALSLSLKTIQNNLARDLDHLSDVGGCDHIDMHIPGVLGSASSQSSTSAHAVLIARGPIQCLVAQYFLESLPLAGLVLVDPLLLPEDGRPGFQKMSSSESDMQRWESSLADLISMLENRAPRMYERTTQSSAMDEEKHHHHPLLLPRNVGKPIQPTSESNNQSASSLEAELSLLHSLTNDNHYSHRPLKLEANGSIPILALYSGDHVYHDYYRICSERTAAFHTCCGGSSDYFDQVSVLKVPQKEKKLEQGSNEDETLNDLDGTMNLVYEWYDEVVA